MYLWRLTSLHSKYNLNILGRKKTSKFPSISQYHVLFFIKVFFFSSHQVNVFHIANVYPSLQGHKHEQFKPYLFLRSKCLTLLMGKSVIECKQFLVNSTAAERLYRNVNFRKWMNSIGRKQYFAFTQTKNHEDIRMVFRIRAKMNGANWHTDATVSFYNGKSDTLNRPLNSLSVNMVKGLRTVEVRALARVWCFIVAEASVVRIKNSLLLNCEDKDHRI